MRSFAFLAFVLVGCSGGTSDPVASPAPSRSSSTTGPVADGSKCEAVTADACKPAFHVATAAEVIAAAKAFDYQRITIDRGQKLSIGDDLVADADIEVQANDLGPAPSDCADCHAPTFRAKGFPSYSDVPGVTCAKTSDSQPVRQAFACASIAIAKGTTFRLRAVIEDMHPSAPTYWAYVDVVAPCATACTAGEVLCAESHTCFSPQHACSYCEAREPAYCACRSDTCEPEPSGASCSFSTSPDTYVTGTCSATGCQPFQR